MSDGDKNVKNAGLNFLDDCANSDELDIFNAESLQNLIAFKWSHFGKSTHLIGAVVHVLQLCVLVYYVAAIYI